MAFLTGLATLALTAQALTPHLPQPAPISRDAIRLAVMTTPLEPQAGAPSDWARVMQLEVDEEVTVVAAGQQPISGRLASVDPLSLTLRLGSGGTTRFERASIQEVRRTTKRRGSKLGAIIGAGAAGFLGFGLAVGLATKDCGGDCSDEQAWMAVSLVGLPVGGGLAGYYLFPGKPRVEVIYIRPML